MLQIALFTKNHQ